MRGHYGLIEDRGVRGRGVYGAPMVGVSLYHSVGDRERAIKQIGTGFATLQNEVMTKAGWNADPYHPAEGPIWEWWKLVGIPVITEWQAFQADQLGSYGTRFATDWEVYESWQSRLAQLRDTVKQHGIILDSPTPAPLKDTIPGAIVDAAKDTAKDIKEGVGDVWKILKIGVYGVLGLGAIVALTSVAQSVRQNKDPIEKYVSLARGRR